MSANYLKIYMQDRKSHNEIVHLHLDKMKIKSVPYANPSWDCIYELKNCPTCPKGRMGIYCEIIGNDLSSCKYFIGSYLPIC